MIILSGLLVVGAIALLVAGIVTQEQGVLGLTGLQLIYVSIAVSVVSALCLAIGVLIRRRELFGPAAARPVNKTRPTGKAARQAAARTPIAPAEEYAEPVAFETPVSFPMPSVEVPDDAIVYVVPGRKRYHLDTCRQLAGRQTEDLTYVEAQEEGFSPCTACLPDTALAARAMAAPAGEVSTEETEPADFESADSAYPTAPEVQVTAPDWSQSAPIDQPVAAFPEPATVTDFPVQDWSAPAEPSATETTTDWRPSPYAPTPEERRSLGLDKLDKVGTEKPSPLDDPSFTVPAEEPAAQDEDVTRTDEVPAAREWESAPATETLTDAAWKPAAVPDLEQVLAEAIKEEEAEAPAAAPAPTVEEPLPVAVPESREPAEEPADEGPIVRILSGTKRYHRTDCALIEDIGEEDEDLESLPRTEAKARGCTPCLVCQPDKEHAH
ncbi:hypothetical protein GCM10027589_23580 [Actinocorallia lasiicapitis]